MRSITGGARSSDLLRTLTVFLFAVLQIVGAMLPRLLGWPETVVSRTMPLEHPLVPIGYAFTIWALIFAGNLAFAAWQITPRGMANPLARRVGWLAAGMYAVNTVWQIWVPLFDVDWVSFGLLAAGLALGMVALNRIRGLGRPLTTLEFWFASAPLGVLTGWLSAATFLNLASTAIWAGFEPFNPRHLSVALALLAGTIAFCAVAIKATRSWPQGLAVVWALHGIVVANLVRDFEPLLAVAALAGIFVVLAAAWAGRRSAGALSAVQDQPLPLR
jgi:hypothetical protein